MFGLGGFLRDRWDRNDRIGRTGADTKVAASIEDCKQGHLLGLRSVHHSFFDKRRSGVGRHRGGKADPVFNKLFHRPVRLVQHHWHLQQTVIKRQVYHPSNQFSFLPNPRLLAHHSQSLQRTMAEEQTLRLLHCWFRHIGDVHPPVCDWAGLLPQWKGLLSLHGFLL